MWVWRMSLQRTKSAIISWAGSFIRVSFRLCSGRFPLFVRSQLGCERSAGTGQKLEVETRLYHQLEGRCTLLLYVSRCWVLRTADLFHAFLPLSIGSNPTQTICEIRVEKSETQQQQTYDPVKKYNVGLEIKSQEIKLTYLILELTDMQWFIVRVDIWAAVQ